MATVTVVDDMVSTPVYRSTTVNVTSNADEMGSLSASMLGTLTDNCGEPLDLTIDGIASYL